MTHAYYVHTGRERIIEAARAVLEKDGLAALTIRKVAAQAGMSPMAMYRHFQDKSALLTALMDDGLEEWGQIARQVEAKDPVRWLERLLDACLVFALTQPHRVDAAFFLPAPRARQYPDDFVAGRSPVVAMALVRVDQAKSEGRLGPKPALEVMLTLSALVQGMVSMHRAGRFSNDAQMRALYRTVVRHRLDSFLVNGSAR